MPESERLANAISALGAVLFEPTSDGSSFRALTRAPAEFQQRLGALDSADLTTRFPCLDAFLAEAQELWSQGEPESSLRSEPWVERDLDGREAQLEAIAVVDKDQRPLLVVQLLGPQFQRLQDALQVAREGRLDNARLERAVAARTRELQAQSQQLRSLLRQVNDAEDRERRRIAEHLHDDIAQSLASAHLELGILQRTAGDASDHLKRIRSTLERVLRTTRRLTFEVSSPVLYELGLVSALDSLANALRRETGIAIDVKSNDAIDDLPQESLSALYQAAREFLHNARKHGQPQHIELRCDVDAERIRLTVDDDGEGLGGRQPRLEPSPDGGFGLFNIAERLRSLGGSLTLGSSPSGGTRAVATIAVTRS